MPSIQEIQLLDFTYSYIFSNMERYYLDINFRYRATVTSLEIRDLKGYDDSLSYYYGGLFTFISRFHSLRCLNLHCYSNEVIGIAALMKSCTSELGTLCIEYGGLYLNIIVLVINTEPFHWLETTPCNTLTTLKLEAQDINVNTLEYIMTKFNKVDNLALTPF